MLPISFAIFGYPPPHLWALPVPMQWDRIHTNIAFRYIYTRIHCDFSSILGRRTYMGFFIDWLIEGWFSGSGLMAISASVSIYFGTFCYIEGMVQDLRARLTATGRTELHGHLGQAEVWPIYVREMTFHVKITRLTLSVANNSSLAVCSSLVYPSDSSMLLPISAQSNPCTL